MTERPTSSAKIDLGRELDFALGELRIYPSACRVGSGDTEERVEPRVMEVLIILARNAGRTVTREQLIDACWGGRVVSDDAVTRVVARVRALGRSSNPPHFSLETLPKVGFRLIVPVGAVEAETQGSRDGVAQEPADPKPWWGGLAIPAAIVIAILAFVASWTIKRPQPVVEAPRVVVSPINVMQTQMELHRVAGLTTTAVIRSLSSYGIPTSMSTSVSGAEHRDVTLAGSTDFDGVTYHVNITVSDHKSAQALWSGSFQRESETLRGLEEEVAYDVATILRCAFRQRAPSVGEMPREALSLLMYACEGVIGWRSANALGVTQRLIALAPGLANAHALRAIALDRRADYLDYLSKEAQDLHKEANAEAQKALELDPTAVAAHVALGEIEESQGNFAKSEHHFRRALEIDPENSGALHGHGQLLRQVGRLGAARETFGRIPAGPSALIQRTFLQALNGDAIETERLLERLAVIRPSWEQSARYMITAFWIEPSAALARLHQFEKSQGRRDVSCVEAHLKSLSRPATARRGLPASCEKFDVDWKTRMLGRQGDIDGAYELLRQPLPNSRSYFAFLFYPEMKAFRSDKRFMPLVDSLGLVRYWRETDQWPDFCAEQDLPYDCRDWPSP